MNNITDNNFENCYYVGVDSDDSDTLFAVNSDSELNNEEVINNMNTAIDKYLENFFLEFKLR